MIQRITQRLFLSSSCHVPVIYLLSSSLPLVISLFPSLRLSSSLPFHLLGYHPLPFSPWLSSSSLSPWLSPSSPLSSQVIILSSLQVLLRRLSPTVNSSCRSSSFPSGYHLLSLSPSQVIILSSLQVLLRRLSPTVNSSCRSSSLPLRLSAIGVRHAFALLTYLPTKLQYFLHIRKRGY